MLPKKEKDPSQQLDNTNATKGLESYVINRALLSAVMTIYQTSWAIYSPFSLAKVLNLYFFVKYLNGIFQPDYYLPLTAAIASISIKKFPRKLPTGIIALAGLCSPKIRAYVSFTASHKLSSETKIVNFKT